MSRSQIATHLLAVLALQHGALVAECECKHVLELAFRKVFGESDDKDSGDLESNWLSGVIGIAWLRSYLLLVGRRQQHRWRCAKVWKVIRVHSRFSKRHWTSLSLDLSNRVLKNLKYQNVHRVS